MITAGENSFDKITRRLRIDPAMGFCRLGYAYASRYPYSYQDFYAVSPDKNCDLFRCVENGKLYLPCENDLQEYIKKRRTRCVTEIILLRLVGNRVDDLYRLVSNAVEEGG